MTDLSALDFGAKGFQLLRTTRIEFTLSDPVCGVVRNDDGGVHSHFDYETAVGCLAAHARVDHNADLPRKPHDAKGNLIG